MPNVGWNRNELRNYRLDYQLIKDCIDGERAVKEKKNLYLPIPNPADKSMENLARYMAYLTRAVFYNVTSRTLSGMVGQLFLTPPLCEYPAGLQATIDDADGNGVPLNQIAMRTAQTVIAYGRAGLLTDYPTIMSLANNKTGEVTDGALAKPDVPATVLSKKDIQDQNIHPTITHYYPWEIINWRSKLIGANRVLTLVVLEDHITNEDDEGFVSSEGIYLRVLKLDDDNKHVVEIWQANSSNGDDSSMQYNKISYGVPTNSDGKVLDYIPFQFVGSETNDEYMDKPPMLDLATMNIAHFRNSADNEESCHVSGQPTLVVTGLTEDWVNNVLQGSVTVGSKGALPLPVGADAKLLQTASTSLPFESMKHKEEQMVGIGAKLVQSQVTRKTATEVIVETTSESSALGKIGSNVSAAVKNCLQMAAIFTGDQDNGINYELNKDFDLSQMTSEERAQAVKEWQSGAVTFGEMREQLRKAGVATLDDKQAQTLIQAELAAMPQPLTAVVPGADGLAEGTPLGGGTPSQPNGG